MEELWQKVPSFHVVLKRDSVPRIHGSLGAFIGVVVVLSIIIIGSCIGIFLLLRERNNLDEERQRRHHNVSSSHPYRHTSWAQRLATPFSRRRAIPHHQNRPQKSGRLTLRGRGAQGWIQAGSTDDWESEGGAGEGGDNGMRETGLLHTTSPQAILQSTSSLPISTRSTPDSGSSVRFDLPARGTPVPTERYSPPPLLTLPSIQSQLSLPSLPSASSTSSPLPLPRQTHSPEPVTTPENENSYHQYVTPAGIVMQTLPGGTKFVEAL